jgi:hypothetical protein
MEGKALFGEAAMRLDLLRVVENVRRAATEDLLDRATVYRDGMEPEALEVIDAELRARGVGPEELAAHTAGRRTIPDALGLPLKCRRCRRPAAAFVWDWYRLWGLLPLFPRRSAYCDNHLPPNAQIPNDQ